jgi:lysophospholipase L1-like esterase
MKIPLPALLLCLLLPTAVNAVDLNRNLYRVNASTAGDATNRPPEGAIVAAGSSTIRLWTSMASDLAPHTVLNRGVSGFVAEELLHYTDRLILQYKPKSVLLYVGDNDLAERIEPADILVWYKKIVAKIRAQNSGAVIYVVSVKPSILRWGLWPKSQEVNKLLAAWAKSERKMVYIDAASGLLGTDGTPKPEYFAEDELHLSQAGYKKWAAAIRPHLMSWEARPAAPRSPAAN